MIMINYLIFGLIFIVILSLESKISIDKDIILIIMFLWLPIVLIVGMWSLYELIQKFFEWIITTFKRGKK